MPDEHDTNPASEHDDIEDIHPEDEENEVKGGRLKIRRQNIQKSSIKRDLRAGRDDMESMVIGGDRISVSSDDESD